MRERIVYPRREILSNDVNSITEYNSYNDEIIVRDLLGVSSGIVNGLNISTSVLTATISSGNISFGNGRFNELLTSSSVTLPNSNGTYYIYAYKSTTTDIASSGYVLLDVSTRLEDYDVVNSRTYDSIGLNYGASTPSSGIVLYSAVVSGGSITSTTDLRSYVTFGNITAYSLQEFYENNKNGITLTASTSGIIINGANSADYGIAFNNVKRSIDITQQPDSHGIYIKKTANGTTNTANSAIKTELRQNSIGYIAESIVSGAGNVIGFYSTSAGGNTNIGFASDNANIAFNAVNSFNGAVGLNVVGYALGTNDAGFLQIGGGTAIQVFSTNAYSIYMSQETNPNVGVGIELRKFNDAINIVGLNSTDSGINITDVSLGLSITNLSQASAQKSVSLNIGGTTVDNYGVFIDAEGDVTAQRILFSNSGASDTLIGLDILSNSSQNNKGTAIKIGGGSNTFEKGIVIEDCAGKSIYIQNEASSIGVDIEGANSSDIGIQISACDKAIEITNSTASDVAIDINGHGTTDYGIDISNTRNAINILAPASSPSTSYSISIDGNSDGNNRGISITNAKYGAYISTQNGGIGVYIDAKQDGQGVVVAGINNNDIGIEIETCDKGIQITNSTASDYGLDIIGHGTSDRGINIAGADLGIVVSDPTSYGIQIVNLPTNSYGIQIDNNLTQSGITALDIKDTRYGIAIDGATLSSLSITNSTSEAIGITTAQVGMNIGSCTTAGLYVSNDNTHQIIIQPKAGNPSSPTAGELVVVDNGSAIKLRIYNSYTASFQDCN